MFGRFAVIADMVGIAEQVKLRSNKDLMLTFVTLNLTNLKIN